MKATLATSVATVLLSVVLFAANQYMMRAPEPVAANAPSQQFSAHRAMQVLTGLLREQQPHPVGSAQNQLVQQRIIARLSELGVHATVQRTMSCAYRHNNCAYVQNIIAVIPGKTSGPYVAVMGHYDSVPAGPGAGDDGAAVAAMLESARALQQDAPFQHPVLMVFTDGEEAGLLGAEAFFRQHPLAKQVALVLNFEGAGSAGISQVIRTHGANRPFIDGFARFNPAPMGYSFANEVLKRMPNDTDFSVAQRAGLPGIDFAFAFARNHYHTPNDNLANLSVASIQHHGDNMLPLVRWLANTDLAKVASAADDQHVLYGNLYGQWFSWPQSDNDWILFSAVLLLGIAAYRMKTGGRGLIAGTGAALVTILSSMLSCYVVFLLIDGTQHGQINWPANQWAYICCVYAASAVGALLPARWLANRVTMGDQLFGGWLVWLVFGGLTVWALPAAANLFLAPLLASSLLMVISSYTAHRYRPWLMLSSLLVTVPLTLGVAILLIKTQGDLLIMASWPFVALYLCVAVPLLARKSVRTVQGMSVVMLLGGLLGVWFSAPYSPQRPQPLNIQYVKNSDSGETDYIFHPAFSTSLPSVLLQQGQLASQPKVIEPYLGWTSRYWAPAPQTDLPAPQLQMIRSVADAQGRKVTMILSSPRHAASVSLYLPKSADVSQFWLDDVAFKPKLIRLGAQGARYRIKVSGVYNRTVKLTLQLNTSSAVHGYLQDSASVMPDAASSLLAARGPLAAPRHSGDRSVVFKQVKF